MQKDAPSSPQIIQKIRLELRTEKFFETLLNEKTCQVSIIQGDLHNNENLKESITKFTETKKSLGEALGFVTEQINMRLDQGYVLVLTEEQRVENESNPFDEIEEKIDKKEIEQKKEINQEIHDKCAPQKINFGQRLIPMSQRLWDFIDEIDKRAIDLKISYEPTIDNIFVTGPENSLDHLSRFIEGLYIATKMGKEEEERKIELDKRKEKEDQMGQFLQKQIIISSFMKPHLKEIEDQANKLNLVFENLDDIVLVAGPQKIILEFISFVYNMTSVLMEKEIKELKKVKVEVKDNSFQQHEFSISTFHRVKKNDIMKKAGDLEIICDFGYDVILVSGFSENLKEFKSYLHEIETKVKKSLYPKYWDFHEINIFSEIDIPSNNEEFKEVAKLFYNSLNNGVEITKVTRIQNKYLMEHYITTIQKRQELRPDIDINRRLLFHGTKTVDPKTIYKNSDTGFDLQYSNPNGAYGKGLYFATQSSYPHRGYSYHLGNGRYQMFLADVFVGKAYKGQVGNNKFVKAPEGYDSVEANNFCVVYNNFHSYPLYLIEYTTNNQNYGLNFLFNNNNNNYNYNNGVIPYYGGNLNFNNGSRYGGGGVNDLFRKE